jgi:hypothetical protein
MVPLTTYILIATGILNLAGIVGLFYRLSIIGYQHKLMWTDFARRKGLNGHAPASLYAHGSQRAEETLNSMADKGKGANL